MSLESKAPQIRRLAIGVLIGALLATFIPTKVTRAQTTTPASYAFEECDQVRESALRDELNRITQAIFAEEQSGVDLADIVERNWHALGLDEVVDAAVEKATKRVMEETELWDRVISGWSPSKAEELAQKVAFYAFGSSDFRGALDNLSSNTADDVTDEIRLITAKSASSALLCVQTFIGDSISPTMAGVLEEEIQTSMEELELGSDEDVNLLDIVKSHSNLAGGVAVIAGTQLARSLGKQLAKRIAGKVVTRILAKIGSATIPFVGWVIGGVLIVIDLFQAREGSLPDIQEALQHPDVKDEARERVTDNMYQELRLELPQLAREVSNNVYSRWQEFRSKYFRVLELAKNYTRFKDILDGTAVEEVQKLAEFVTLIEDRFGLERLNELIEEGHFERLFALPEKTLLLLDHVDDPLVAIHWADLAGELLTKVIETELFRVGSSSDFRDRAELEKILALDSAELVRIIMVLDEDVRDSLLGLPTDYVAPILVSHTEDELSWLARSFFIELGPKDRHTLVDFILDQPGVTPELKVESVRTAILNSGDIRAVLNYVGKRTDESLWLGKTLNMFSAVGPSLLGKLPMSLFWHYDGGILLSVLYVLAGLIALYVLWRRVKSTGRRAMISLLRKLTAQKRRGSV